MAVPVASSTTASGPAAGNPERLPDESVGLATSDRTEAPKGVKNNNPGRQEDTTERLPEEPRVAVSDIIEKLCAVDMSEVYSPLDWGKRRASPV